MVGDLKTDYGKFEAMLRAVGDFADGASYKSIDPKNVLSLAEHYENNGSGYYNSLALDIYSKASLIYGSLGDGEIADMFLGKCEIIKSGLDLCPRDALVGICAVNRTLREGGDSNIIWADDLRDHANGLLSGLKYHDKIHKEWAAVPGIYFRMRHECNFPIKYIEETIDGIMSTDSSI